MKYFITVPPEKVMNAFKSYASRHLNQLGIGRSESDARATEARDGYGKMKTFRNLSDM
jgi:hypothetical protein